MKGNYYYFFHLSIPKLSLLALFTLLSYASVQCKAQENKEQIDSDLSKNDRMISIQQDTIKKETFNQSKTFLLKVEKIVSQKSPVAIINYAVYESGTQKCIKEDSYQGVDVQWNDNTSLKLIPYIGMERKPVSENPDDIKLTNTPTKVVIVKLKDSL